MLKGCDSEDMGGADRGAEPSSPIRPGCIGFAMMSCSCPPLPYAIDSWDGKRVSVPADVVRLEALGLIPGAAMAPNAAEEWNSAEAGLGSGCWSWGWEWWKGMSSKTASLISKNLPLDKADPLFHDS